MKAAVIVSISMLLGCGLDTVKYLNNPSVTPQTSDTLAVWTYTPTAYSGTNFQGYEIYYKYYVESIGANYGSSDQEALKTSGGVSVVPTPERLLSLGYLRFNINEFALNPEPVVTISPSDLTVNLKFEIDFSELINATFGTKSQNPPILRITNTNTNTIISETELRRGVRSPFNTNFRRFWEVYDLSLRSQQPNLESSLSTALSGNPPGILIVLFVMAYGWSPEQGREISEPVYLGTIKTFTLNW